MSRWPFSAEQRFWSKVDKSGDCWLWTGKSVTKKKGGYGRLKVNGKSVLAHRYAWELRHGPIPEGKKVLHRCDVPLCMTDEHHFLGSQADNVADRQAKGRTARGDRSGARLHPERLARGKRVGWYTKPESRATPKRGEDSPRAILTEAKVRVARELAAAGLSMAKVAKRVGLRSPSSIHRLVHGKSWAHVR
jgi:hypothetical protein